MEQIEFRVGAKAAKLIGRENISAVDGAIVELIKNAYDADAECVYIKFNMPFPNILKNTTYAYLEHYLKKDELTYVLNFYEEKKDKLIKKEGLTESEINDLQKILFSKNEIIVVDNGSGMTKEIMKTTWMNIATSDKEKNMYSKKGRIKTGAKGIGRFALEKLSLKTQVYTKDINDKLIEWSIDWKQFDNVELLNEIKANLDEKNDTSYTEIIKNKIGNESFKKIKKYNWNSGTMIILSPTREEWNERLFKKVNSNIQSINPLGNVDTFDVHIENEYNQNLNYVTRNIEIEDYDYRIKANYDGDNNIKVLLRRNEVDINVKTIKRILDEEEYEFNLDEFWKRGAFSSNNYSKESYEKEIEVNLVVDKVFKDYEIDRIKQVGPFSCIMYFMKSGNGEIEIIKKVNVRKRKELLNNFSGIKLYRDNFKVRPYGEKDDGMYDWLNMGLRAQKSPAGISHLSGNWRVLPYQLIGWINIGRNENNKLVDMANREGLATNEQYYIFIDMIQEILSTFEYDRQYIYREFAKWVNYKTNQIDRKAKIIDSVRNEKDKKESSYTEKEDEYSKTEYRETLYKVYKEKEKEKKTNEIIMAFSSSGIITNTFAHELKGVENEMGYRMQHLRHSVNLLLNNKKYEGDEDFDPYIMIEDAEKTDKLLNSWISVIMNAIKTDRFEKKEVNMREFVNRIIAEWKPLMDKKQIFFNPKEIPEDIKINIEEIDLYLIFNNFFLNSAWFLEKVEGRKREIYINVEFDKELIIYLENNGPILDKRYENNPDRIFDAGETSKENTGTGMGLWITREIVNKNFGEIHNINKDDGFGIKINIPIK